MVNGLIPNKRERVAIYAKSITYKTVMRALENARTPREGLMTVNAMLSKVSRRTRNEIRKDILNPYKLMHEIA